MLRHFWKIAASVIAAWFLMLWFVIGPWLVEIERQHLRCIIDNAQEIQEVRAFCRAQERLSR